MSGMILTQSNTFILGPIAKLLGLIMNGIFNLLDMIGIPNIGLSIILFTIIIYLLMMPLTIKQQKFSKLQAKMSPELQAISAKYKGKKDNDSMMAMNQETQAVYAKYGVSQTGSCLQLLIQMPILLSLYKVIYSMPAYVTKLGDTFRVLASKIIEVDNGGFLKESGISSIESVVKSYGKSMNVEGGLSNGIIDVLNKLSSTDLASVAEHYGLYDLTYDGHQILSNNGVVGIIEKFNNFLGLNMGNSPSHMVKEAMSSGAWLLVIGGLAVPVLAALTQWINTKLMPQPANTGNEQANSMAASMKTMNMVMPIMSAFFCYTLPSGMGLYWIAGSVVRSIQQIIINKHIDKMDLDEEIKKNVEKRNAKLRKRGIDPEKMNNYASMNTRNIGASSNKTSNSKASSMSQEEKDAAVKKATEYYNSNNAKPGSIAAKANMVKQYNERNNK